MILTCPECATRYLAEDEEVGPNGRTVRCSKCFTTWFVAADADALTLKDNQTASLTSASIAVATPVETDNPAPFSAPVTGGAHVDLRDKKDRERRNRRLSVVGLIWGITLGALGVAALLGYLNRQEIIERFPETATLYEAFGIEVSQEGLSFDPPVTRSLFIDGEPVLVINGSVKNISTRDVDLPLVALSLHNSSEDALAEWAVEFESPRLGKGERAEFVAHFPNPPLDAVNLRYQFAGPDFGAPILPAKIPETVTDDAEN